LTLNLGLRWDGVPAHYEANNRMGNFYPSLYDSAFQRNSTRTAHQSASQFEERPNQVITGLLYQNGIAFPVKWHSKGLVDNHWANFGPRMGCL